MATQGSSSTGLTGFVDFLVMVLGLDGEEVGGAEVDVDDDGDFKVGGGIVAKMEDLQFLTPVPNSSSFKARVTDDDFSNDSNNYMHNS